MSDKPKRGRPWKNPVGARPRTLRMTEAEYREVVRLLRKLRGKAA